MRKEFGGKIKLENKIFVTDYNKVVQKVTILWQAFSELIVSGTRSASHKIVYQYFEIMKSIWRSSPNVEPVLFCTDSILEDNGHVNGDSSHNNTGELIMVMQLYRRCHAQQPKIQILIIMIMEWKILTQQKFLAEFFFDFIKFMSSFFIYYISQGRIFNC